MDRLPKSASKSSIENDVSELDEDDVAPMHLSTDMALHECAKNGRYNEMKALLSNKELNVNVIPEKEAASQGLSALHLAVRHNHMNCVKLLLARGADVNIEDNFGFKPVHDACLQGNLELLQLLLHHGATADGIPKDGLGHLTPMLYAARHNHIDCLKRLSKKFGLDDAMLWDTASKRGNAKVLQYLSATDIPADMLPSWIHNSAVGGQTEFLSRILQTAGFELTEEMATIALLTAAQHGHTHFLGALIDYGVNPNICGKNNVTALHNAARYGQVESIVELIQSGANTESLTDERWTPLHVAVRQCQEDAVTTLIEMGACIDSKGGPLDETALHLAVVIGDIPVLKSLLQGNPSLLAQNKNCKTVLQLQLRGSIRDLLIKHAKS